MDANRVVITTPLELQALITDAVNAAIKYNQPSLIATPATAADAPDLLTIKQAAELINLAVPTIYGMVRRNEIPVMKRAKKLYFSRRELEAWVREGRKKTAAECAEEVRDDLKSREG